MTEVVGSSSLIMREETASIQFTASGEFSVAKADDDDDDDERSEATSNIWSELPTTQPPSSLPQQEQDDHNDNAVKNTTKTTDSGVLSNTTATTTTTAITVSHGSAMECSKTASQYLSENRYDASLEYYQRAAETYIALDSVVAAVNAAGCFRNMGAVSRYLGRYDDAVNYLVIAQELYEKSQQRIVQETTTTSSSTNNNNSNSRNSNTAASLNSGNDNANNAEHLCLDEMVLETMQSRATFHFKHQHDICSAVQVHEAVLARLLELHDDQQQKQQHLGDDNGVVVFTPLAPEKHLDLLVVSLENLGGMYRTQEGSVVGFDNFVRAVQLLQQSLNDNNKSDEEEEKQSQNSHENDDHRTSSNLQPRLTQILRNLSEIYCERHCMDKAVDALHDAMDIELSRAEEPSQEALEAMDKMGLANEQMESYDKALACYEKALLARSRYYGEEHIDVAKSLVNVARVLELQGNTEGSLDLYKAAHLIYALQITSSEFQCASEDAEALLELIPSVMEQGRFEEARSYLTKCLAIADEHDEASFLLDKSLIYYNLGRAYMGMRDYVSATICLVEAAKEEGEITEEKVFALLQRVEFLQRQEQQIRSLNKSRSSSSRRSSYFDKESNTDNNERALVVHESSSQLVSYASRDLAAPASTTGSVESTNATIESSTRNDVEILREHQQFTSSGNIPNSHSRDDSFNPASSSTKPSSGSTLPTLDLLYEEDHGGSSDVFQTTPSFFEPPPRQERQDGDGKSPKSDLSSLFHGSEDLDLQAITIDPVPFESSPNNSQTKLALLSPRHTILSDDTSGDRDENPLSSDSNQGDLHMRKDTAAGRKSRGLRRSPRKMSSGEVSDTNSQNKSKKSKGLSVKLRRRRRGFQSLPEEVDADTGPDLFADLAKEEGPTEEEEEEEEEHKVRTESNIPCDHISIRRSPSMESAISDITMRFEDPNSSRESSQEWWWGVTAEGFGRWFPTSYVSQAVQAADAFLSAKAIHSKSKPNPSPSNGLGLMSEEESTEENDDSREPIDYSSNVGITSTKASRVPVDTGASVGLGSETHGKPRSPHHDSVFSSPAPRHFADGKDVISEISKCRELLVKQQKEFGSEHSNVATSLFTLAVLYSRDREINAAIECATEALRIQRRNGDFEDSARSVHFLADLYLHQKQYKQALTRYAEALKMETDFFGYYSDATARTLNCIGTVKSLQNEFREAMESHEEALRILKGCHGENLKNPLVSETLCQIGSLYYRERNSLASSKENTDGYATFIEGGMLEVIGRAHEDRGSYKMAIAFFEEKLQFLESKAETEDNLEDAATTLNGLGMLSARAGLLAEAIDYYEKALSIQLQLGCDEVQLATARVLTGAVQFQMGNWRKALKLLQDALLTLEEELGERHETVAATHYQIGIVQAALCEYDIAMDALKDAFTIQSDLLGDEHPATLRTRREIGNLYAVYEAELPAAFDHFNAILDIQKRVHAERHPNIAETLQSIGTAHARQGDYSNALRKLEECYYMRVEFLGWDHPLQATTLHEIAKIHLKRKRLNKALHICDVVLGIRTEALSDQHIDVARALTTKGACLVAQGDTDKAMECLMKALAMTEESVGETHPCVAEIYSELGSLHVRKCQFKEARTSIQKALDIYCWSNLDDDYPGIQDAKEKLERVERDEMLCV